MLKNNNFIMDVEDVRSERANLMSENIDSMAATVGVAGALLTWAQNVDANWKAARITADTEGAQPDEAFQEYHIKFSQCRERYIIYKELLLAIIYDLQPSDELIEEYNIKGRTPRNRERLTVAVGDWRNTHDRLDALGDDRVVPEAYVVEMETLAAEFDVLWHAAIVEKDEAVKATAAKEELFAEDTDKFRIIYRMAVVAYGPDGSDLRLLGFVPASEVHTPGQPEPGMPVFPDEVANLKVELSFLNHPEITFDYATQPGVTFDIYKDEVKIGAPIPTELPAEAWLKGVEGHSVTDSDAAHNRTNIYWVVPVFEGENGEVAGPVTIDYKPE